MNSLGLAAGEEAGIGLVDRWLIPHVIRDGLADRAPDGCMSRIACVREADRDREQRSDVVFLSKNDGLRLYRRETVLAREPEEDQR